MDDAGGLSVYETTDFKVINEDLTGYELQRGENEYVHNLIAYPSFYEDYYNDDKQARENLMRAMQGIYEKDCSEEDLVDCICCDDYSDDMKCIFLEILVLKTEEIDTTVLLGYFHLDYLRKDMTLTKSLFAVLAKSKNEDVYHFFLAYLYENAGLSEEIDEIVRVYFDDYY
ncbi:hypothetical protein [Paenilisteria weihenstephanensis]|uniref:hypothetical protein n=1 Tax=Listeria weihenstephanensis TaxID=1006155 RepID=UPI001180D614|nr:hypothetical protein [Listeria weihenstephanensis]